MKGSRLAGVFPFPSLIIISRFGKCLNFRPPPNTPLLSRLLPQDRLIYLDIAEDFMAKAERFYPPNEDSDEDTLGLAINLPLLLARVEAMKGRDKKEEDEDDSDREGGNLSDRS